MARGRLAEVSQFAKQPLTEIGHGAFSFAYRTEDGKTVFVVVKKGSWDKEILATAHEDDPKNPHIPAVQFVDALDDGRRVYRMPFYESPIRTARKQAWAHFRAMRDAHEAEVHATDFFMMRDPYQGHCVMSGVVDRLRGKVPAALLRALEAIKDASTDYGSTWWFEFAARNLATDAKGRLVLLDPIYDKDFLQKMRNRRRW